MRVIAAAALAMTLAAAPAAAECRPGVVTLLAEERAVAFRVEIARTPEEQARGLMHRTDLDEGAGMLFVYDPPRPAQFWMKNTLIPLDMIFLDDTGRVVNIAERADPLSLTPRRSRGPVRAVLEINGGLSDAHGIAPGTQAVHPAFRGAPEPHRCPSVTD